MEGLRNGAHLPVVLLLPDLLPTPLVPISLQTGGLRDGTHLPVVLMLPALLLTRPWCR